MGGRGAAGIGISACALVGACSLGDFSGFSDGDESPDGGSASDAPVSSNDGGTNDSSTPITPNDGGSDSAGEAGFCQLNADAAFFCEDFEGPNPLLHFNRTITKNGTLVVENGTMLAVTPPNADASEVGGFMSPNVTGTRARIAFSVRPEELNTTSAHAGQIAKIYFFGISKAYEVGIGINGKDQSNTVYVYEFTTGSFTVLQTLPALTPNVYTRFVLEARIGGASVAAPRVDVDREGQRVVDAKPLTPPLDQGIMEAVVGVPYTDPGHGSWKLRFDDVLMVLP